MPKAERDKQLDAIQHVSGYAMRQEAVRLMRIADAQIKNLRATARDRR
jgi:hypothetical protein